MTEEIKATYPVQAEDPKAGEARARGVLMSLRVLAIVLGLYAIAVLGLGVYWSIEPKIFDVRANALERVNGDESRLVPGAITVAAAMRVGETLLEKAGGFLSNDLTPPGLYLDNMPSWEDGVLKELRDSVRSLRNDFSRSQSQSIESPDLKVADAQLNFDMHSWMLPPTESEYRNGIDALQHFFDGLTGGADPKSSFYVRADNLAAYLGVVEKRLGSLAQRLSSSVGDEELTAALVHPVAGGAAIVPGEVQPRAKTPWLEVDDVFYESRGYTWALLHMTKALAIDFDPVLRDKNAQVSMQQVIRELAAANARMWSPVVLNGHGFGFITNHSLIMASYIAQANAAVHDLRELLERG